jgi:class 3 adenylate cyclase/HAMP domain-containing protein
MSIRLKIILIVLPLLVATLLITGAFSYFSASYAISLIAKNFLAFKADELSNQAESQWNLLVENNLTKRSDMVDATKAAVGGYAQTIRRSPTELMLAFAEDGSVVMSTSSVTLLQSELPAVLAMIGAKSTDLVTIPLGGKERVAKGFWFEPFKWYLLVTEERATFYSQVNEITMITAIILIASLAAAMILILVFASYLTSPLTRVANTMKQIISTNDLSQRVVVEYRDEIGGLAQTFNLMVEELEKAYGQIKSFAFKAVIAQKREQKIKNLFQMYVPKDVIEQIYANPESALVGENRVLSILFSDIRSFTTISEKMMPDDLVNSLNRYFTIMVDVIMGHNGIVDKYIGDAIMAFFGAPVKREDDGLQSVMAGIEMCENLTQFNAQQTRLGKPPFRIGVGINYGVVTVGNIGSEKKMNYTVIGDRVNLASRLEELTKEYRQELIISESLYKKVKGTLPCRLIDSVVVKGKTKGERIYTTKRSLDEAESQAWELHNAAMEEYYRRSFGKAAGLFQNVQIIMPDDHVSAMMMDRCLRYEKKPPSENWDGTEIMTHK